MAEQNNGSERGTEQKNAQTVRRQSGKQSKNITMADMFRSLMKNMKCVVLLTLAGLLLSSLVTGLRFMKEKDITRYRTEALIAIVIPDKQIGVTTQWQFSTKLVASAEKCLYTKSAAQGIGIREETGANVTREKLISSLSFYGDDDEKTQFITLTLVWDGTAEETREILESAISQLKPQFEKIGYGDTVIIDPPCDPVRVPIRPNYLTVIIGTFAGLMLGCALAVLLGLFRETATDKDVIMEALSMDTVGEIPYSPLPSSARYLLVNDHQIHRASGCALYPSDRGLHDKRFPERTAECPAE